MKNKSAAFVFWGRPGGRPMALSDNFWKEIKIRLVFFRHILFVFYLVLFIIENKKGDLNR